MTLLCGQRGIYLCNVCTLMNSFGLKMYKRRIIFCAPRPLLLNYAHFIELIVKTMNVGMNDCC